MANAFDTRIQFHTLYWYGVGAALLLFLSMVLAFSAPAVALLVGFLGWLITMPYHGRLALLVGVSTFGSALLVPFMGRPYLWEFAGILAWTGVPIALMLRQYPPDTAHVIRGNRWIFIGAAIYCATLVEIMLVRGVGLRILGSSTGGGRFYFQQIICAMFPLLFVVNRLDEKMLLRLFVIQLALRMTYLLSDLAFSILPGKLGWMMYFLGLSTDMANFRSKALSFGIRRYQSLGIAMPALLYLLLVRYNIRDFFGRRAWWLLPTTVAIVGISLLSGHRSVIIFPAFTVILVAWSQRFLRPRNLVIAAAAGVMLAVAAYIAAPRLPLAAQRTLSFLPGIEIDSQAAQDAKMTWLTRRIMFELGLGMAPHYLLVGRGFTKYLDERLGHYDAIEIYLDQGTFFNGFIGLLVNTGLTGMIGMMLFLYGGMRLAGKIFRHVRQYGSSDNFARAAVVMASIYFTNVFTFLFLHGNAEWAMKYFSVLSGMLIVASRILERREEGAAAGAAAEATGTEESALEKDVPAREPLAQPT